MGREVHTPYVIWGMGRVARHFYDNYCREFIGEKPLFWCDSDVKKQGTYMAGVEVISPDKLFALGEEYYQMGKELSVVLGANVTGIFDMMAQCQDNVMKARLYSVVALEAGAYYANHSGEVEQVAELLADDLSRKTYLTVLDNMQKGRFSDFSIYVPNPYFGNDVFGELSDGEIIVDAGVCHGEEIDKALYMNHCIMVYGFEPDMGNYKYLLRKYAGLKNVKIYPYALWHEAGKQNFSCNAGNSGSSRLDNSIKNKFSGGVETYPLDIIVSEDVSFIKMDIEGAEMNALRGAAATIKRCKPKLAISIYHSIEDYVRIPLLIHSLRSDYKFYVRQHSVVSAETVLYAI